MAAYQNHFSFLEKKIPGLIPRLLNWTEVVLGRQGYIFLKAPQVILSISQVWQLYYRK